MLKTFRTACIAMFTAALAAGCATNTMTGRSQLSLVSDEDAAKQSLGLYTGMVADLSKKNKLIVGTDMNRRIEAIANKIIAQAVLYHPKSASWDWKLSLIDEKDTVNAFCMPGGLMGIYTGLILKLNATDAEVAMVLAHETAHALASHGAEKMSMQQATSIGAIVISAAASKDNREYQTNSNAINLAALAFINLPNSRVTETEADAIGIELAARAGYDPSAAVSLWKKMAANSGAKGKNDFFSTHPAPERRIENLSRLAVPMAPLYKAATESTATTFDWLNGRKDQRPKVDQNAKLAFYSASWDAFQNGRLVLSGSNLPGFVIKQGEFESLSKAGAWRDLASLVINTNYDLDLSYLYLSQAAYGMGFKEAGKTYLERAVEMHGGPQSCQNKSFVSCKNAEFAKIDP